MNQQVSVNQQPGVPWDLVVHIIYCKWMQELSYTIYE